MSSVRNRLMLRLTNVWWMHVIHHRVWVMVGLHVRVIGIALLKLWLEPLEWTHCQIRCIHGRILPGRKTIILLSLHITSVEVLHRIIWLLSSNVILIHRAIPDGKLVSLLHLTRSTSQKQVIWHWDIISRQARSSIVDWQGCVVIWILVVVHGLHGTALVTLVASSIEAESVVSLLRINSFLRDLLLLLLLVLVLLELCRVLHLVNGDLFILKASASSLSIYLKMV